MNLPNKITISRLILSIVIIILLIFPFDAVGLQMPRLFINESIVADIKYFITGILFIIAVITDFVDGYIAKKYLMVTNFGRIMDTVADEVLIKSVLIILTAQGFIHPVIPVIIVMHDVFVKGIKMVVGNEGETVSAKISRKCKSICLMVGITLTLFYNIPFEFVNLKIADFMLMVASILAIISGFEYYEAYRYIFFPKKEN